MALRLLLLLSLSCFAESERVIYSKIMSLNKGLNEKYVIDLAKHLKRYGELYGLGHDTSLAIAKKLSMAWNTKLSHIMVPFSYHIIQ